MVATEGAISGAFSEAFWGDPESATDSNCDAETGSDLLIPQVAACFIGGSTVGDALHLKNLCASPALVAAALVQSVSTATNHDYWVILFRRSEQAIG